MFCTSYSVIKNKTNPPHKQQQKKPKQPKNKQKNHFRVLRAILAFGISCYRDDKVNVLTCWLLLALQRDNTKLQKAPS